MKNFLKGFTCMGVICLLFITISTNIYTDTINDQEQKIIELENERDSLSQKAEVKQTASESN